MKYKLVFSELFENQIVGDDAHIDPDKFVHIMRDDVGIVPYKSLTKAAR